MNLLLAVLGTSAGLLAFLLEQLRKRNRELLRTSTLLTRTGDLQAFVAHVNQAAALLDDEATLKRLRRRSGQVELHAENPQYAPIVAGQVTILGRLVGIVRTF